MKEISKKIVKHKTLILIISLLLLIPAVIGMVKTKINYNVLVYLPEDIETMKGQDILTDDFNMGAFSVSILENMSSKEILDYEDKVRSIDGVEKVFSIKDVLGTTIPIEILPSDLRDKVYKDNTYLLAITFKEGTSNEKTLNAVEEIRNISSKAKIGGMSAMVLDTMKLSDSEVVVYVVIAVILCILVLMLCLDSYLVPFILLINIGIAILYNMGTNIFLGDISYITKAISAVLQLGVTTDFSIFLYHRYEFKKKKLNKEEAMADAINDTFISVAGSSLTTIAGFLALCTMTLLLGKDIGIVMAKGVLLGVICVLTLFPALLLIFDKAIDKTTHKVILPEFKHIKEFTLKHYKAILIVFLILLIPAYIGNKNVKTYYNLSESLPKDLAFNVANEEVKNKFGIGSPSVVMIDKNIKNNTVNEMVDKIKELDGIEGVISYSKLSDLNIPETMINDDIKSMLKTDKYQMIIINSKYDIATNELNDQIGKINDIVKSYDSNSILAGEGPLMKDLIKISDTDFHNVNYTSIAVIFIIMIFVLKSISLPIILIIAIEFAIFLNMATFYYSGVTLPFIASIVIGTIQLGATIDYAILMTTKYLDKRKTKDKFESMKHALDSSVGSIITSALCFFAATAGVGFYSKIDMIGSICNLISRGAIISMIVVIFILPSLILCLDKLIIKTTKGFKKGNKIMNKKVIATMLVAVALPMSVSAAVKDETVYSIIDSNGNTNTTVSEILKDVNGDVLDESDLENILNVNGNEEYFKKDYQLTWKSNGNNIYYQGTTQKKLPIELSVKYYLNDEEVNVKSIKGKEGHIKLVIDYKNLDKHGDLYTPFVVTMGTIIRGNATNVSISTGKIINNGNSTVAVGLALPYLDKSLNLSELSKYNNITIEYDTTSFEESDIYNVYSSNLISSSDFDVFNKLDEIYDKINLLGESSTKLVDGANQLSNGMNEYNKNFKKYKNGIIELNKGTKKLNNGYKQINGGLYTLNSSLSELASLSNSLGELKSGLAKTTAALDQISAGLNQTKTGLNGVYLYASKINAANSDALTVVLNNKAALVNALGVEEYTRLVTDLSTTDTLLNADYVVDPTTGNKNVNMIAILNKLISSIDELNNGVKTIETGLNMANDKIDLNTINTQLSQLQNGVNTLYNGSSEFSKGLSTLSSSTDKIEGATSQLYDASNTINNGLETLNDGISKFDEEGIQKIVELANGDVKSMQNKLTRLVKLGEDYTTFTKKNNKMKGETKFIVKIEA